METHVFLTNQAVRSLDGLTAFSALPNAPVLPVKQRRRPIQAARRALLRQAATRPVRRLTPATHGRQPVRVSARADPVRRPSPGAYSGRGSRDAADGRRQGRRQPDDGVERVLPARSALRRAAQEDPRRRRGARILGSRPIGSGPGAWAHGSGRGDAHRQPSARLHRSVRHRPDGGDRRRGGADRSRPDAVDGREPGRGARRPRRRARRGDGVLLFGFAGLGRLVAPPAVADRVHRPGAATRRHMHQHRRGGRGAGSCGAPPRPRSYAHRDRDGAPRRADGSAVDRRVATRRRTRPVPARWVGSMRSSSTASSRSSSTPGARMPTPAPRQPRRCSRAADRPTAVLCFADVIATGVLRTARQLGIDVPGELSIVGFDDAPFAATSTPPLTTVRQDIAEQGPDSSRVAHAVDRRQGRRGGARARLTSCCRRGSSCGRAPAQRSPLG